MVDVVWIEPDATQTSKLERCLYKRRPTLIGRQSLAGSSAMHPDYKRDLRGMTALQRRLAEARQSKAELERHSCLATGWYMQAAEAVV